MIVQNNLVYIHDFLKINFDAVLIPTTYRNGGTVYSPNNHPEVSLNKRTHFVSKREFRAVSGKCLEYRYCVFLVARRPIF